MTPDEAFLRAVREAPEDDAPRLIYADWLEEQGDSDRAEFIRVQCALARMGRSDPRWRPLWDRERDLIVANGNAWSAPLRRTAKIPCRPTICPEVSILARPTVSERWTRRGAFPP